MIELQLQTDFCKKGVKALELTGVVEEFIYQNESNSYTIAIFMTDDNELHTVVGYLPFIVEGDNLKITGKWVNHPEYGEQFKIESFEKIMPQTAAALEKYLASGTIKGIGPATAKKIIDKLLPVIETIKL